MCTLSKSWENIFFFENGNYNFFFLKRGGSLEQSRIHSNCVRIQMHSITQPQKVGNEDSTKDTCPHTNNLQLCQKEADNQDTIQDNHNIEYDEPSYELMKFLKHRNPNKVENLLHDEDNEQVDDFAFLEAQT